MRPDWQKLLETQAAWQRARAQLSWPKKIRLAELMREAAGALRGPSPATADRAVRGAMPPTTASRADASSGATKPVESRPGPAKLD